jgi:PAS domain S-box-containing protein
MADEHLDETQCFETLLADLSTAQVTSSVADLQTLPLRWLERIVAALGIDRASFFERNPDTGTLEVPYAAARPGCPAAVVPLLDPDALPWYTGKLLRGERVLMTDLPGSLPPEAAAEQEYCHRHGLRAHLAIPYRVNGTLLGGLGVTSFSEGTTWNLEQQRRIALLSQVFANAIYRARAHRELVAKETRLQLAMDAANVGIWEWNFLSEQLSWSEQLAGILGTQGTSPSGLLDHGRNLVHPEDYPHLWKAVQDCIAGQTESYRAEHRILRPDGTMRWVECHGKVIRDETGAPLRMIGTVADISERKRADAASRASARMYESLVNTIDGIVWELDVPTFRFTYVSPQAERILGYPLLHWLENGDFWPNHLHPEDRHWVMDFCTRATAQMRDHEFQYRMLAADGRIVWLHDVVTVVIEDGRPSKLRGIMVDITARKNVEEALRESERNFRAIFEEASIGLAYVDANFQLRKVNRALCEFLGYTAEELQNKTFVDITHPEDIDADAAQASQGFRGEINNYRMEKRYLRKNGEIVWGHLTVTMLRDPDGKLHSAIGMVENITGRKSAEEQLRQAQKMEALGRLAGGVAHDFNNLLTAIKGYCELSMEQLPADHWLRGNLAEILQSADRASALTRQLLAFGRKQVRRPKLMDLSSTVDDMQRMLRRLIGENIKLTTSIQSRLGTVLADPSQIEQVLVNLVVNARDAMPQGGRLTVELSNSVLDQEYVRSHPEVTPGPYVMLSVSDTGIGMSRAVQQRIFEPFFTTKEPGRGTGLGLPMVYGIVKQSDGHIWVYSEEGVGTHFKIYLPIVNAAPEASEPLTGGNKAPGGHESILLVEDDDSVRNMIVRILSDSGYRLCAARDGMEALQLCEGDDREFQLLITDVIMPKMSGRQLAETLGRRRPQLKVLYISGYAHDGMVHHGVLDAGVTLLEKPFSKLDLLRQVREVLTKA